MASSTSLYVYYTVVALMIHSHLTLQIVSRTYDEDGYDETDYEEEKTAMKFGAFKDEAFDEEIDVGGFIFRSMKAKKKSFKADTQPERAVVTSNQPGYFPSAAQSSNPIYQSLVRQPSPVNSYPSYMNYQNYNPYAQLYPPGGNIPGLSPDSKVGNVREVPVDTSVDSIVYTPPPHSKKRLKTTLPNIMTVTFTEDDLTQSTEDETEATSSTTITTEATVKTTKMDPTTTSIPIKVESASSGLFSGQLISNLYGKLKGYLPDFKVMQTDESGKIVNERPQPVEQLN